MKRKTLIAMQVTAISLCVLISVIGSPQAAMAEGGATAVAVTEAIQPSQSKKQLSYVYDVPDPGASISLPLNLLDGITDQAGAIAAIRTAAAGATEEQKRSPAGIDLLTLYAEEAIARAGGEVVEGGSITIDQPHLNILQTNARDTRAAAERALSSNGVNLRRSLRADVRLFTYSSASVTIAVYVSAARTLIDNVRVVTPDFAVTLPAGFIRENAAESPLYITIARSGTIAARSANLAELTPAPSTGFHARVSEMHTLTDTRTFNVEFSRAVEGNIKISLPPTSGDPAYQAIMNSSGDAIGGKHNPVTRQLEAFIDTRGTYSIKDNKLAFADITAKPAEMQEAINILASKGIVNGTTATTFNPDGAINRAEIAALIVRVLGLLDANADGGFMDVRRGDWYFGAVGSARKHGIVNGITETAFAPMSSIQKDQIVAICSRVLRNRMNYGNRADGADVLSVYADYDAIAPWSRDDIALATRENLVAERADGMFSGSLTMTRGDAAVILYRMFLRIW